MRTCVWRSGGPVRALARRRRRVGEPADWGRSAGRGKRRATLERSPDAHRLSSGRAAERLTAALSATQNGRESVHCRSPPTCRASLAFCRSAAGYLIAACRRPCVRDIYAAQEIEPRRAVSKVASSRRSECGARMGQGKVGISLAARIWGFSLGAAMFGMIPP